MIKIERDTILDYVIQIQRMQQTRYTVAYTIMMKRVKNKV